MAKLHFRDYNPKQILLFPQRLDKDIAENDPVRIVDSVVDHLQTPGDPFTMIPFLDSFRNRYDKYPQTGVADSGYGSEENYRFMDERGIEAYVKYNLRCRCFTARRCIEPEAVFGQIKFDMAYKRFRHFGLDKVKMDFAFFAIAFNLKKMCSAIARKGKIGDNTPLYNLLLCLFMAFGLQKKTYNENYQKSVA